METITQTEHAEELKQTFTCANGHEWLIDVNVTSIAEVKKHTGFDMLAHDGGGIWVLYGDTLTLVKVLYVLCEKQMREKGVSPEDFGRGMKGDAIWHATRALIAAMIAFFPHPHHRRNLMIAMQKVETFVATTYEKAREKLDHFETVAEQAMARAQQELEKETQISNPSNAAAAGGASSIDAPASSASTQDRSPSADSSP